MGIEADGFAAPWSATISRAAGQTQWSSPSRRGLMPALRPAHAAGCGSSSFPVTAPTGPPIGSPPRRWTPWLAAALVVVAFLAGLVLWGTLRDGASGIPQASAHLPLGGSTLVVMPFEDLGEPPAARTYADGLTEEILSQFARFKEITVLGRETSRSIPPGADATRIRRELGRCPGASSTRHASAPHHPLHSERVQRPCRSRLDHA